MRYHSVQFQQGQEALGVLSMIDTHGSKQTIEHLVIVFNLHKAKWKTLDRNPAGGEDQTRLSTALGIRWQLNWNPAKEYYGLCAVSE